MYSIQPYYYKRNTIAGSYSRLDAVPNLIMEPRQNGILFKVDHNDLTNIVQSIPFPKREDTTALVAYYRYVFLVKEDLLIKMETVPELEEIKTVRGFRNTTLTARATTDDGPHIYTITDGELRKINMNTLEIVKSSPGWENARLMDGIGPNLYIVVGDDLINIDAKTLHEKQRISGWSDANLLTVPGNSYIYIFKNDELIKLSEGTLQFQDSTRDWAGTRLMAGAGRFIYLIRDGELICLLGSTLKQHPNVPVGSGWENATLMSSFINYIFLVTEEANSFKNPEMFYRGYADYNQHNCQLSIPRAPYYYYSSYYPYYPYFYYFE
ncbi:hypothetical protein [Bacillus sp. TD11]|uniref:hypothetical protein n=1 Tax=Bacillus sp. TD11 TaxID=3242875 RepID=UPI00391A1CC8